MLPMAVSKAELKDVLKIEVTADSVLVDQEVVAQMQNFLFREKPVEALRKIKETLKKKRKADQGAALGSHLLVMADERTPYETLQEVLGAASQTGFVDLQLVIVQEEQ